MLGLKNITSRSDDFLGPEFVNIIHGIWIICIETHVHGLLTNAAISS
jgi:hypothetical protein